MKKLGKVEILEIIGIVFCLFLIGCETRQETNKMRMDLTNKTMEQKNVSAAGEENNIQEQYFYFKACEEMVDLKIELVEKAYQQSEISRQDYKNKIQQLRQEESHYLLEKNALDYKETFYEPSDIQDSDGKAMKKRLRELKQEEEELEKEMEKTKKDYTQEKISQEDFILKRSKQEEEAEKIKVEKEWLERVLEH